jgi:uncharacterized protein (DUF1778 family)
MTDDNLRTPVAVRLSKTERRLIADAARIADIPATTFIRDAAVARAKRVTARPKVAA